MGETLEARACAIFRPSLPEQQLQFDVNELSSPASFGAKALVAPLRGHPRPWKRFVPSGEPTPLPD